MARLRDSPSLASSPMQRFLMRRSTLRRQPACQWSTRCRQCEKQEIGSSQQPVGTTRLLAVGYYLLAGYLPGFAGALTGAVCVPSSTECEPLERTKRTTRLMDVHMKMMADHVVRRVSTLAAARGPKAVCEPWPPKAPARSAERPCCSRTTPIRKKHTITCRTITK